MYLWNKHHVENKGGPPYVYRRDKERALTFMSDNSWYRTIPIEKDEMGSTFIPIELSHLFFTFKYGNRQKWDSLKCIPKDDLKNILKEIAQRIV